MKNFTAGYPMIKLQSVDSTNSYAAHLLRNSDVVEGTVILAVYQTMGKGYQNSRWISEAGCNILFSLILRPDFLLAERQFYLSMCISNAIHDFIMPLARPVQIKWPNDILLQGRKVAGILIENTVLQQNLHTSVVGIGLNINQKEFLPDLRNPTSLALATGKEFDLSESLNELLRSLDAHIDALYEERYAEIKTYYLNNLHKLNEWAEYTDSSGTFTGRIADVADSGELIVLKQNGTLMQYGFKQIELKSVL
jgi:BirA family transcriptional regulator, biotin operon repressor / biotin---[acetyl-CoA-carboxylase] ligase